MAVFTESFARLRQDLDQSHENRQRLIEDIRANVAGVGPPHGRAACGNRQGAPRRVRDDDPRPSRVRQAPGRGNPRRTGRPGRRS